MVSCRSFVRFLALGSRWSVGRFDMGAHDASDHACHCSALHSKQARCFHTERVTAKQSIKVVTEDFGQEVPQQGSSLG